MGAVMTAVAGSIALVAFAFALNAALAPYLSPAWASAATAGVFAAICCVMAIVTPKLISGFAKPAPLTLAAAINPVSLGLTIQISLAILGGPAEASRRRRADRVTHR
jgi:hypothetical protein